MTKIFIYAVPLDDDIVAYALGEDGQALASHVCSNHMYAHYDMGLTSRKKHYLYEAAYPDGYELIDLLDLTPTELMANKAFVFAHTKNTHWTVRVNQAALDDDERDIELAGLSHNARKPPPVQPKTIPYWPYCEECKVPYDFDEEEPFAYCNCGTSEWGYPRPAPYVKHPDRHSAGGGA